MALSTEDANKVFQKVNIALDSLGAKSGVRDQFRALKAYLSQIKRNPDLQFIPIADLTADVAAADAPCKLYGVFLKKQNTATDAFYNVFDDASNDATEGDKRLTIGLVTAEEQAVYINNNGFDLAAGLVHGSYTAAAGANGSTPSTSGDGPNGFVIIGKP